MTESEDRRAPRELVRVMIQPRSLASVRETTRRRARGWSRRRPVPR
jgi:hypothetical protein